MKRYLVGGLIVVGLVSAIFSWFSLPLAAPSTSTATSTLITLGSTTLKVDVAADATRRERGLSGQTSLAPADGLLFIFDQPGIYPFWMKEMKFSIDIIWIDQNRRVVAKTAGATPESFPKLFIPPTAVQYVLEIPAGTIKKYAIGVGDQLILP